jgi:GDP-mannose 6-dehydrogenase
MNISVFGLGYVGSVSLGCLAQNGHIVIGVDVNKHKIDLINKGKPTIIEKDIEWIIKEGFALNRIKATSNYSDAIINTDITIITVGTPSSREGHLHLGYINHVAEEIGEALQYKEKFHTIVIRSTVLPGTNRSFGEIISKVSGKTRNKDFAIVSNPEFLREGSAVSDYYNPPVTVIGSDNNLAADLIGSLYEGLPAPIQYVTIEVAEMIKYVNNAWHALKIGFSNEVGNICKMLMIDSWEVMELFMMDRKLNISDNYLKPGFAYGGSCLPKDLKALCTIAHDNYLHSPILNNIENSNKNQKQIAIQLIESLKRKRIGLIGLSFKAETDDLRYSPMVEIAEYFLGKGYQLKIFDKNVNLSLLTGTNKIFIESHIPHLSELITDVFEDVIDQSETIVIAHQSPDFEKVITDHPDKMFVDLVRVTRNKYDNYEGICW